MALDVLKPGALSTFQDLGRTGRQAMGVPVCGAMDPLAHRLANLVVGNAPDEATLEITLLGPTLRFDRASVIALAGADFDATLQAPDAGRAAPMPRLRPVAVAPGTLLRIGAARAGVRAFLARAGGYGLPAVMGSRSTYLRGAFGGHEGRALRTGDRLPLPDAPGPYPRTAGPAARAELEALATIDPAAPIRLVDGPEAPEFTADAIATLFSAPYRIATDSDRMGYRLEGPPLARIAPREMLSEAVALGTVQVPANGQPIVLMADRQTTGGYPRIAQVASVDLPVLAQRAPGATLRFERIGLVEAQRLLLARERTLAALRDALARST